MPAAPNSDPNHTVAAPGTAPGTNSEFNFGPPAAPGEAGTLGPYRVVKEIGRGGMGAVFRAVDRRLEREAALKVMLPANARDASAKERLLREARAVALVSHEHVVTIYEADERDGVPYIAMQFLQGYTLDDYFKKKGSPPLAHCVRIAREAALGLAAAHAMGLVHRDIKPGNLWLEAPHGRVKILDFGLAKPVGSSDLTATGAVVGSPAYMSPEQARGQKVDARTDVFSLGAVLYQSLTGRKPFQGEHALAVLTDDPTPVCELNPNVPAALAVLVHEMLAKDPAARPQTAAEVAECLRTVLAQPAEGSTSLPVVVQPLPVPVRATAAENDSAELIDDSDRTERDTEPSETAPKRRKALLVAGGALALALAVGAAVALGTGDKKQDEPRPKVVPTKEGRFPTNPKAGEECDIEIAPNTKMRFCYIPAGECQLGSPNVESSRGNDEDEHNRGKFSTNGFWLGKYEVTQSQWAAIFAGTLLEVPSVFRIGGAEEKALGTIKDTSQFPVENVSLEHCKEFLNRAHGHRVSLGEKGTLGLPHEDEWEYACRGGTGNSRPYYFGPALNGTRANCNGDEPFGTATKGANLRRPQSVGSYEAQAPHPWGLCDMHGNVWEWRKNLYDNSNERRVVRGGAWVVGAHDCRAAKRDWSKPTDRGGPIGFRVIFTTP